MIFLPAKQKITTIDLWLPVEDQRTETYDKAFRAGFDVTRANHNYAITPSYDRIEIYYNCNVGVEFLQPSLSYRHTAILFYREDCPIRLIVDSLSLEKFTQYYNHAMVQRLGINGRYSLQEATKDVVIDIINLKKPPLRCRSSKHHTNPQIISCDRWDLFLQLIDNIKENDLAYRFSSHANLTVYAELNNWIFKIPHRAMFYNDATQHYIALQSESPLAR